MAMSSPSRAPGPGFLVALVIPVAGGYTVHDRYCLGEDALPPNFARTGFGEQGVHRSVALDAETE
jgi:hypothetical protein